MADSDTTGAESAEPRDLPESIDAHEAAALMAGIEDEPGAPETPVANPQARAEAAAAEAQAEDAGEPVEAEDGEAEAEAEAEDDSALAFWKAEDRAKVPPELRSLVAKYEKDRIAYVNEKSRELAAERETVNSRVKEAEGVVEQAANWWKQNGPAFAQAFGNKWSQVDWNRLAEENPAEWARLKQAHDNEARLLMEADQRGQRDMTIAEQRAKVALVEAKRSEHGKLAQKYPDHFGPEKAAKTYEELGNFLVSVGIPAERVNQIYEAPVIELALDAMRYRQAQRQASATVQRDPTGRFTATPAPKRVQPGPAVRPGNQASEAVRQARQRFNASGDVRAAAELMGRLGL